MNKMVSLIDAIKINFPNLKDEMEIGPSISPEEV